MLFFIGMPGTGKSYWASTIATAYGLPFVDLDTRFYERVQMPIAEYFDKYGQDEFRKREQETLHDVITSCPTNAVVACGGGTPVFFDNLQRMKTAGCTVYLRATLNTLVQRLTQSPIRRPLLEGKDLRTALMELYTQRSSYFLQADHIFDVESISVANFTEIIPSCISQP